jgi:hypothetical protein
VRIPLLLSFGRIGDVTDLLDGNVDRHAQVVLRVAEPRAFQGDCPGEQGGRTARVMVAEPESSHDRTKDAAWCDLNKITIRLAGWALGILVRTSTSVFPRQGRARCLAGFRRNIAGYRCHTDRTSNGLARSLAFSLVSRL